ncbi:hypothetical protein K502DRAFT_323842 [Neoconidiobolus thromboides FSU 785]|nr:hypothetical protein K502DRAFT_323842 [Neoconidiobolus thromboides FSU 785]
MSGIKRTCKLVQRCTLIAQYKPSKLNELKIVRGFQSGSLLNARNKGSLFGWDLFGKKEEDKSEDKLEALKADKEETVVQEASWAEVKEVEQETVIELTSEQKKEVISTWVKKVHPEAIGKSDQEINKLSLEDGKVKFELLTNIIQDLVAKSEGGNYDLPNRNLNNIETVEDILEFYVNEKDQFDVMQGHGIEKFIREIEATNSLPPNLAFEEFDGEMNKSDSDFNKKGKTLNKKYFSFIKANKPRPSRH